MLDYDGTEIVPEGYICRNNLGEKKWRENPPQWHIVAWALRRPWIADKERGPTFNAYLNGIGYWARYGASDTDKDRFLTRFGPSELSHSVRLRAPRCHRRAQRSGIRSGSRNTVAADRRKWPAPEKTRNLRCSLSRRLRSL